MKKLSLLIIILFLGYLNTTYTMLRALARRNTKKMGVRYQHQTTPPRIIITDIEKDEFVDFLKKFNNSLEKVIDRNNNIEPYIVAQTTLAEELSVHIQKTIGCVQRNPHVKDVEMIDIRVYLPILEKLEKKITKKE